MVVHVGLFIGFCNSLIGLFCFVLLAREREDSFLHLGPLLAYSVTASLYHATTTIDSLCRTDCEVCVVSGMASAVKHNFRTTLDYFQKQPESSSNHPRYVHCL